MIFNIHLRAVSQEMPQPYQIILNSTYLEFHLKVPEANELNLLQSILPAIEPVLVL